MKVPLTHAYYIHEDEKEQKIMKPYPPLGILSVAAWLDENAIDCEVYDTTFAYKRTLIQDLLDIKPDIVAIYANLMTKLNVIEMIKVIKSHPQLKDACIVLGGPDLRHNVDDYLSIGSDILVIGEGEQTMLEIVQTRLAGNTSEYGHIDGVAYRSNGETIITPERSRIRPVDSLPYPARQKIDMQPYLDTWKENHGKSAMTVSTQRGCPYTCKWCSTAVYGQSYRRRSPQLVAEELKYLKDTYNPDSIWFVDDVFTVSHKWLEEFATAVNDLDAKIPFECITRADRTVAYPIKGTSLYKEVEDKQIAELDWTTTTDRDRDFERTYSRKYYDYAVRWVVNEVNATRVKATSSKLKMRTKSVLLRQLMQLEKLRGN